MPSMPAAIALVFLLCPWAVGQGITEPPLPRAVSKAVLQSLLQGFVDRLYLKGFRHLGDERDFDHGHFLLDARERPVAVLYHTQELAHSHPAASDFGYLDAGGRNWIQWLDGRIENAAHYLRKSYPRSATWDWFRDVELPALRARRTILDKMLDPELIGIDPSKTAQCVFTKKPCSGASDGEASIEISLPTKERVCLALSRY